jgi:hypothetical protein
MWDLGDIKPLSATFRDAAGALIDPGTVTLTILLPDNSTVTPSFTHPSTGIYECQYPIVQSGSHDVRWLGTGVGAVTEQFDAAPWPTHVIISLEEAKSYLNIDSTDTAQDEEIRSFIGALTAPIEMYCGAIVRQTRTKILYPCYSNEPLPLPYSPVISITSAALLRDGSALTTTGWYVDGPMLYPGVSGFFPLEPFTLTYVAGRPDLPDNIRLGALYVLKLAWRSQRGNNPDSFMGFLVANAAAEWFAGDRQLLGFG